MKTLCAVLCLALMSSGCLVLSVHPGYDEHAIGFDAALVGRWESADDHATLEIDRGEWKSYRIHYVHPIETGDLTGYLTSIGSRRFLDVMPARGEDRGAFLVPVHALLRVQLEGDRLELTPLSYDWFSDRLRGGRAIAGLHVATDQKDNALILSPADRLREWVKLQPADGPMFGASAAFTRKK